jgi:tetratricopeptide (TPR) repeat protein
MSYLLEILGRGLIAQLVGAFETLLGGATDESIESLREIVANDPGDLGATVRLGARVLRIDDAVEAQRLFRAVLARDERSLAAHVGLACSFDSLNQFDAAIEELRFAQKLDPVHPAILFCLGYCHERQGNESEAVNYYQNALTICPTLRNAYERLAAIAMKNNRPDWAIIQYTKLCELDPQLTDVQLTLASLLQKSGDFDGAIQQYERALSLEPDNWTAHNDAAAAYEQAGLIREAIEHLHKSLDGEPEMADVRLRLGDLYARIGNDVAAVAQYHRAVEINPEYLEANVKLGTQHLRGGRFQDASHCFSRAMELNDRLLTAYIGIGVAQHAAGREKEAQGSFEMARSIEPNSTLLFSEVARMQLKSAAAQEGNRVFGLAPQPARGDMLTDLISQQIDRLKDAIARNPNHADLHYRLGLLYKNRGQVEDAVKEFQEAVAINPVYIKALVKLGLALNELDREDEAISALKQAVDIRPNYVDLHYQLGLLFSQRHKFEMAVEHFEHAALANPQNISFQANLALALQNLGLVDRATATWQIVQDLDSQSPEAAQARSEMAKQRKD